VLLALETTHIAAAAVVLVLAALIVALLARAIVSRRARSAKQLPQAEKRETIEPPRITAPVVAAPVERVAREQRAREELSEAEEQLRVAREAVGRVVDEVGDVDAARTQDAPDGGHELGGREVARDERPVEDVGDDEVVRAPGPALDGLARVGDLDVEVGRVAGEVDELRRGAGPRGVQVARQRAQPQLISRRSWPCRQRKASQKPNGCSPRMSSSSAASQRSPRSGRRRP